MNRPVQAGPRYRPDIDGLRAVAIVPVMLFHAGWTFFSGGYIGVDVFFVVSGYLITSLISGELAAGRFSFVEFWLRRARRILPALGVVVLFTLAAGWFLFFPTDYRDLGRSALTQAFFSSNIYFWLKSGYFAAPSETKPLLHTWSLSVEEQYYLLIPLTLFWLTKYAARWRSWIVFILLACSFLVSAWSSYVYPDAAFYLPHTRAWELLIGSLLALTVSNRTQPAPRARWISESLSVAGLLAIVGAAVFYDRATAFPGVAALAPCMGAAAVIWSNTGAMTFTGRILAHRVPVWIGLISYSLYLWHWPLLAFARYSSPLPLSTLTATCIVFGTTAIAWLSYRYVETPVREWPVFRRRLWVIPSAATVLLAMFLAGMYVNATGGVRGRKDFQAATFEADISSPDRRKRLCEPVTSVAMRYDFICRLGAVSNSGSKLLLVGDSFAEMYLQPLTVLSQRYQREVWYVKPQNVPVHPYILQVIRQYDVAHVVLSYSWKKANKNGIPELYPPRGGNAWLRSAAAPGGYDFLLGIGDTRAQFRKNLASLVEELRKLHVGITIIDSPPYYTVPVPLKLGILVKQGGDPAKYGSPLRKHLAEQNYIYDVFREVAARDVQIVAVTDALCDSSGFCRTYQDGHSLYSDDAHLSEYGARQTTALLEPTFARITESRGEARAAMVPRH